MHLVYMVFYTSIWLKTISLQSLNRGKRSAESYVTFKLVKPNISLKVETTTKPGKGEKSDLIIRVSTTNQYYKNYKDTITIMTIFQMKCRHEEVVTEHPRGVRNRLKKKFNIFEYQGKLPKGRRGGYVSFRLPDAARFRDYKVISYWKAFSKAKRGQSRSDAAVAFVLKLNTAVVNGRELIAETSGDELCRVPVLASLIPTSDNKYSLELRMYMGGELIGAKFVDFVRISVGPRTVVRAGVKIKNKLKDKIYHGIKFKPNVGKIDPKTYMATVVFPDATKLVGQLITGLFKVKAYGVWKTYSNKCRVKWGKKVKTTNTQRPTPRITPRPTPRRTPKPTPRPTPRRTPKPTPRPTPRRTPKPTPRRTERPPGRRTQRPSGRRSTLDRASQTQKPTKRPTRVISESGKGTDEQTDAGNSRITSQDDQDLENVNEKKKDEEDNSADATSQDDDDLENINEKKEKIKKQINTVIESTKEKLQTAVKGDNRMVIIGGAVGVLVLVIIIIVCCKKKGSSKSENSSKSSKEQESTNEKKSSDQPERKSREDRSSRRSKSRDAEKDREEAEDQKKSSDRPERQSRRERRERRSREDRPSRRSKS